MLISHNRSAKVAGLNLPLSCKSNRSLIYLLHNAERTNSALNTGPAWRSEDMEVIYAGVLWGAIGLGLACILLCARGEKTPRVPEASSTDLPEA